MRPRKAANVTVIVTLAFISSLSTCLGQSRQPTITQLPIWLWVMDDRTGLGIVGASIDIKKTGETNGTTHFVTGQAGRVLIRAPFPACIPDPVICRVTLHGQDLQIVSASLGGIVPHPLN